MNNLVVTMFLFVVVIGIALLIFISFTRRSGKILDQDKYRSQWLLITQNAGSTSESWQFAVMSADKLLDTALKERGVRGNNLGERLKNSKHLFSNIDHVWRAHKLRNKIAHENGIVVSKKQAADALKILKTALTDLGAL
jgi:hypothetical protein